MLGVKNARGHPTTAKVQAIGAAEVQREKRRNKTDRNKTRQSTPWKGEVSKRMFLSTCKPQEGRGSRIQMSKLQAKFPAGPRKRVSQSGTRKMTDISAQSFLGCVKTSASGGDVAVVVGFCCYFSFLHTSGSPGDCGWFKW